MIGVSVQGVVKRFGETTALAGIDVEIAPGELFFLLGPSGCGKTTLLRCLAGFYIPEEGKILFGDEDVTKREPEPIPPFSISNPCVALSIRTLNTP